MEEEPFSASHSPCSCMRARASAHKRAHTDRKKIPYFRRLHTHALHVPEHGVHTARAGKRTTRHRTTRHRAALPPCSPSGHTRHLLASPIDGENRRHDQDAKLAGPVDHRRRWASPSVFDGFLGAPASVQSKIYSRQNLFACDGDSGKAGEEE